MRGSRADTAVYLLIGLLIGAAMLHPSYVTAANVYMEYDAGPSTPTSTRASVWSPDDWGWVDLNVNGAGAGAGVVNDAGSGRNAWRISDRSLAIPNPAYVISLSADAAADAARDGWRWSATARYVEDLGTGPNMGISAFLGGRAYHLMLSLSGGDLHARLYDETVRTYQLTTGGVGATAFHDFELRSTPGSAAVSLLLDNRVIAAQWDGIVLPHVNTVQWGNSNQAGAGRGVMDYQSTTLEIGPFVDALADYDGDGDGDGNDLLIWQRQIGTPATSGASSATPEPRSGVLAVAGGLLFYVRRRRFRGAATN